MNSWYSMFANSSTDFNRSDALRSNLTDLIVNVIAQVERMEPLLVQENLKLKKIPLPLNVYQYIYPIKKGKLSYRHWIWRWFGRKSRIENEALNDTLKWIESYLEKKT